MKKFIILTMTTIFSLSAFATPQVETIKVELDKNLLKSHIEQSINKEIAEIEFDLKLDHKATKQAQKLTRTAQ